MTRGRHASISFDRIADRYDETRGGMERARNVAAGLAPLLASGPTLEVGVGTGAIALALDEQHRPVVGVDISQAMLRLAVDRLGSRVAAGDAHQLPVRSASCANVVFVWVLHVVGDPVAALTEARRVLVPGGRVIAVQRPLPSEPTDVDAIVDAMHAALRGGRLDASAVLAQAETAGLTLLERSLTPVRTYEDPPAEMIERIEQRTFSSLWDVDDSTWSSIVRPAIERLRALPEPDRPRTLSARQELLVFVDAGAF